MAVPYLFVFKYKSDNCAQAQAKKTQKGNYVLCFFKTSFPEFIFQFLLRLSNFCQFYAGEMAHFYMRYVINVNVVIAV